MVEDFSLDRLIFMLPYGQKQHLQLGFKTLFIPHELLDLRL